MPAENIEPKRKRRFGRLLLIACAVILAALTCLYLERTLILTGIAKAWIVNEPTDHADAIIILGGGLQSRPFLAASMYQRGISTNILVARSRLSPTDRLGLTQPERFFTEKVLAAKGVPPERVQEFGEAVASTRDEAVALRQWILSHPEVKRIIIPTENFHTRRAKWIFTRVFRKTPAKVNVIAIDPEGFNATNWWRNEDGLITFEVEVVKSCYYHFKYWRLQ